ncbi:bifunctional 2-polyprenyl-6-hydroxyphenol methylase/3-demethylubiquinol 3-O-methyltransferase UbiG [Kutzneria buriramensis]|uniref:Methyltransferase family protein n=1 Tax=Kutzneria buriramensis TaxID=1045776 RepID=A0A3E0GWS8_9PSEU|nr:class I SAM-dependent methyltransferase [Kutzneria buriramensis]REH28623.1 methyltransferase family protein [Kutzneria buriramensis]
MSAVEVWERYASNSRPRRAVNAAGASTWLNWTQYPDHGPDESVLGDLAGRRVLELGSGSGANLAHLATLGVNCKGVDLAPSRTSTAVAEWGHLPGLEFITTDAVTFLAEDNEAFDVVYSIFGAIWFTDPPILLTAIRAKLRTGGVLAFSHLPATEVGVVAGPAVSNWNYPAEKWENMLAYTGFTAIATVIAGPADGEVGTLLVRATAV